MYRNNILENYYSIYDHGKHMIKDIISLCEKFDSFDNNNERLLFAEDVVNSGLVIEFLEIIAEEFDVNISSYLEESQETLVEKAALVRGIVNALSRASRSKALKSAGLKGAEALGKSGKGVAGTAASTSVRSARKASQASMPAPKQPGQALVAQQAKRASRGLPPAGGTTAGSLKAVTQRGMQRHDRAVSNLAKKGVEQAKVFAQSFMKAMKHGSAQNKLDVAAKGTKGTGVRIGQPGPERKALPSAGQSSKLSPAGQEIRKLNQMTGGGPLGMRELPKLPRRAPKPAWGSNKPSSTDITKSASGTPSKQPEIKPVTVKDLGNAKPSFKQFGLTNTVRATLSPAEKSGNMKYPGLEKYATGSSSSGGPGKSPISSLSRNLKTAGIVGTAAAGAVGLDQIGKENKRKEDQKIRQSINTNVYNTMDSDNTIRSRKKVGPKIVGTGSVAGDFDVAFKKARTSGQKEFEFRGKKYTTKMKENFVYEAKDETEEGITGLPIPKKNMGPKKRYEFEKRRRNERAKRNDPRVGDGFSQHRMTGSGGHGSEYQNTRSVREEVLSYLLDEGFASDEKSAEAIMGAMSEAWICSIMEAEGGM